MGHHGSFHAETKNSMPIDQMTRLVSGIAVFFMREI